MQAANKTATSAGLFRLLQSSIDYAGLFPPASLPVPEAVKNFAAHRANGENWLVSKFVCTPGRLAEVMENWRTLSADTLHVTLVGRASEDANEFVQFLADDVVAVRALQDQYGALLHVACWELRLPESVTHRMPSYATYDLLNRLANEAEKGTPGLEEMYFETSLRGDWKNTIPSALDSIFRTRVTRSKESVQVRHGFKLRCGGATADDFPSVDLVALALRSCRNAQIPIKFTAGLHHPIRNYSDLLYTNQHGFLNIFIAGLITWAQNPDMETVKNILNDMAVRRFLFTDESVGWAPLQIDLDTVERCRHEFVTTFGSCSISEPVADLRSYGLI